jgi:hypothetical protein
MATKKAAGPKETQLRALRQGTGAHGLTIDKAELRARLAEARAKVEQDILSPYFDRLEKARAKLTEAQTEVDDLEGVIEELTGRESGSKGKGGGAAGGRQRRSRADLEGDAQGIMKLIKDGGKEGVTGPEIRAKYPDVGQSITAFVTKYGGGAKLKTTGHKASTRYFAE